MKKYTQEEFDRITRDEYGIKNCPSGDYSLICRFGKRCSFGEWCSFGERCSFEENRVKNGTYFACDRIGSEKRKTYFFIDENKDMFVRAGCFFGTLDEFIEKVEAHHKCTRYKTEYLMAIELAKVVLLP